MGTLNIECPRLSHCPSFGGRSGGQFHGNVLLDAYFLTGTKAGVGALAGAIGAGTVKSTGFDLPGEPRLVLTISRYLPGCAPSVPMNVYDSLCEGKSCGIWPVEEASGQGFVPERTVHVIE